MRVALLVFLFALWLSADISSSRPVPSECGRPPALTDGDVREAIKPLYNHNERVEYMCRSFYTMEGDPYRTCIHGEWTGSMRCRKPCTVNSELMSRHNIRLRYTHGERLYAPHNGVLTFACVDGARPVEPEWMRGVCVDGVMDLPICQGGFWN